MSRRICVFVAVISLSLLAPASDSVSARPLYKSVWDEMYRERLPDRTKATCSICHPAKSKEDKNEYGKALAKELGGKNVKDRERIREALKKIEVLMPVPLKLDKR